MSAPSPFEAPSERKAGPAKRQREAKRNEFSTAELHFKFERHVATAQDAFLRGDTAKAEAEATLALRIRPTAHLFAFLAVVAESKGQFDRASDFRLLQAFLARDPALWEELLHEFLSKQLYYKSVVCLQRMSALEGKDAKRFRTLQLQLSDLFVGLGEIKRAADVLLGLWEASGAIDFEVFAQLSSLYFQLGKWGSLQGIIAASLKSAFHITDGTEEEGEGEGKAGIVAVVQDANTNNSVKEQGSSDNVSRSDNTAAADNGVVARVKQEDGDAHINNEATASPQQQQQQRTSKSGAARVSKKVRFFGVDAQKTAAAAAAATATPSSIEGTEEGRDSQYPEDNGNTNDDIKGNEGGTMTTADPTGAEWIGDNAEDEFSFLDVDTAGRVSSRAAAASSSSPTSMCAPPQLPLSPTTPFKQGGSSSSRSGGSKIIAYESTAELMQRLYTNVQLSLRTDAEKRNFITLVNVLSELFNELGKYADTARLIEFTAACLETPLLDLPPDLLVRLGTAYAYDEGYHTQCQQVFAHLLTSCTMEDYGDVLLDAAIVLQKVGLYEDAIRIFDVFARYYQFRRTRLAPEVASAEDAVKEEERRAKDLGDSGYAAVHAGLERPLTISGGVTVESLQKLQATRRILSEVRAEYNELNTVLATALYHQALCCAALGGSGEEEQQHYKAEAERLVRAALEVDPMHLQARLMLGRLCFSEHNDFTSAVAVLTPREGEPALQRVQLGAALVRIFFRSGKYVEAIATGVSIFELIRTSADDGDTQSVAPGTSSRRSSASGGGAGSLRMPTMSRASSAIVPASRLGGLMSAAAGASAAASSRRSFTLAASIRAGTSVFRQNLIRSGRAALTTTIYGASAAASIAAGWDKEEELARLKDTSTIFRFHRRRRPRGSSGKEEEEEEREAGEGDNSDKDEQQQQDEDEEVRRKRQRLEAITSMQPSEFWGEIKEEPNVENDEEAREGGTQRSPTEGEAKEEKKGPSRTQQETKEGEAASGGEGRRPKPKPKPKQKKDKAAAKRQKTLMECLREGGGSMEGERDRDLVELETFAKEVEEGGSVTTDVTDLSVDSEYTLPTLEDISLQFQDPAMAQLFMDASTNLPISQATMFANPWDVNAAAAAIAPASGGGYVNGGESSSNNNNNNPIMAAPNMATDRVTIKEALDVLGKREFMSLAVCIVDCYSVLGKFTEAKEFAFLVLKQFSSKRQLPYLGNILERPLRLAILRAAMAAGESEDAYRVGLRLFQEDTTSEQHNEVIELLHGVQSRSEGDHSPIIHRFIADGNSDDVSLLVLRANSFFHTRSYIRVLNFYLAALQQRPNNILLSFVVGLSFILCSHQKKTRAREAAVSAGMYYLSRYQQLLIALDPTRTGEALYNSARALQYLKLPHLCVPLYERVIALHVPRECTQAVQRAARVNLYFVYRWTSGNRLRALSVLPDSPFA